MKQRSGITDGTVVTAAIGSGQAGLLPVAAVVLTVCAILVGGGLLLISCLGTWWPVFDIASHFAWHALGGLIGGGVSLALLRFGATKMALGAMVAAAIATLALPAWISSRATFEKAQWAKRPADGAIRIVSLNTWHANETPDPTVAFLEDVQADVVFLSEFGPPRIGLLRRLAASYPHRSGCAERFYCAVQVISRHPIAETRILSRDRGTGPPSVHVTFGDALKRLHLIGVHLMRPIDSYRGNLREVKQIAAMVREREGDPVVVVGDFNLTAWSWNFATFRKASGLDHMAKFMPSWPTGRRGFPQLAIDHAFASSNIRFTSVGLGPDVGSDHKPLIIDVLLPDAAN